MVTCHPLVTHSQRQLGCQGIREKILQNRYRISTMVLTYSYLKPRSTPREWLFRKRLVVESTFAMTMCQPWEKAILCSYFLHTTNTTNIGAHLISQGVFSSSYACYSSQLDGVSPIICRDSSTTASIFTC